MPVNGAVCVSLRYLNVRYPVFPFATGNNPIQSHRAPGPFAAVTVTADRGLTVVDDTFSVGVLVTVIVALVTSGVLESCGKSLMLYWPGSVGMVKSSAALVRPFAGGD